MAGPIGIPCNDPQKKTFTKTGMTPFEHKQITSKSARLAGAGASSMTRSSIVK